MAKRFFLFFYLSMLGLLVGATVPSIPSVRPLVSQVDVYCRLVKEAYPDVPVMIGGVEASLRRFAHYD